MIGTLVTADSGQYRAAFDSGQHWESNRADARPSGQDPARPDFGPDRHVCSDVAYDITLAIYDIMHSVHDIIYNDMISCDTSRYIS
jgi:hypothetical protein